LNLWDIYKAPDHRLTFKWRHYFDIYERYLAPYINMPVKLLEIGVLHGGSLQVWKRWLGPQATIVGVDINPNVKFSEEQIHVRIGNQGDDAFLGGVLSEFGLFDIVIDDGSHIPTEVLSSLRFLYPHMANNGWYFIEDLDSFYDRPTFFAEVHRLYLELNAYQKDLPTDFTRNTRAIHLHPFMLAIERGENPRSEVLDAGEGAHAML